MYNTSKNTKRIAQNTLILYMRMLFNMLISLYTSRVVLNTLGVEDYGIYNVVGGFVSMCSLLSGALSHSTSRFLTFELGRGNMEALKRYFSTALQIHIILAFLILCVAETIGVWFLNVQMTIPEGRIYAANWVFQASVVAFMINIVSVPYNASIVSHEKMTVFAYVGILDTFLKLLVVLFIAYLPWQYDNLIVYSLLLVLVASLIQIVYTIYCRKNFDECRLGITIHKICWKEMWSFTGWNFIGGTAVVLKDQGINILLNLFFSPVVNAARGLSITVSNAAYSFVNNFMTALNPQITKSYASGDYSYMFQLIERGTRFSFYIILFLGLPILLNTDFILALWLKDYPAHTTNFVRLILILAMIDTLSNTIVTAQAATGNIRNYQIMVGGMLFMNFPLSYLFLALGGEPECTMFVALFVSVCCLFLRLTILRKNIQLSVEWFLKKVCCNVFFVSAAAIIVPLIVYNMMDTGWLRFLNVSILSMLCSTICILFIGCSSNERKFIWDKAISIKSKFRIN